MAALMCLLYSAPAAWSQASPPGCTGSAIGINLFTSAPDVHVGDTIQYSITAFNGLPDSPRISCDAREIEAFVVTPDGVSHPITLVRTALSHGQSDFYNNVVSYVVRAQDIRPDGTVRATASISALILQNDTPSRGSAEQGVNTEVNQPCILITVQCVPGIGENGVINFTGTVTNCGNNTLVNVTVTNFVNGGQFPVAFITNLARGQVATFSGSWVPSDPCVPSTATLVARGTDQFTTNPRTVTSSAVTTCSEVLTPGIRVTKVCPITPVAPGQLLTFSGSVSNTGNVTLRNIVVVNNQPTANTTVFTLASLAPGASANFTGSYFAPTNCSVADTLTSTGTSTCGTAVTSTASATCPILTTPALVVTAICPTTPIVPGSAITYTGTVRNSGNITLTNVVVLNNQSGATPVFTAATLAPGAIANFTSNVTIPANACAVTSVFTGTARDICTLASVTNTVSATCSIVTAPAIAVTLVCPVVPVNTGGLITYTGTVRNSGNVTLNNVTVLNNQSGANPVFTAATLAPGASANFTASFTAPADACSVSSMVTARGSDSCSQVAVTNTASATCALTTTPNIVVTQVCPVTPTVPGALLTYTGTVRNSGNITLTNVIVMNNLSGTTPVFTAAILAPGASANFTGSYLAPTNCNISSTLTGTGRSICGISVTNTVSTTCPILTAPALVVTAICPTTPIIPGSAITYTGTVRNSGNITLTNIVVFNNQPVANTPVFSIASLAPGATANFTSNVNVPIGACAVTSVFTGTGRDICTLVSVTNTVSATCSIVTAPAIAVTLVCPVVPVNTGGLITYTGTVRNNGNVTLNNVTVLNNQSGANPVFTAATLAPGASANFTASFTAPADACSVSSMVTARGVDSCSQIPVSNTASATCTLTTTPNIVVTQVCPVTPTIPGALLTYTGTVRNAGDITLTNVIVMNNLSGTTPIFTAVTLAPGAVLSFTGSYIAPTNCNVASTLTGTGRSICGISVTNTVSTTCPILTAPALVVTAICPTTPIIPGSAITYTGTVRNSGNITLTNVVVLNNQSGATPVFTAATLAPGAIANFTSNVTIPANACAVTSVFTGTARDICTLASVTNTVSATCSVVTAPAIAVTLVCPAGAANAGSLITYTGTVRNNGNVTLNNVTVLNNQSGANPVFTAATLAPGASANFTASFTAPANVCSVSSTVTARGVDSCSLVAVSNTASATCTLATTPNIVVTQVCPVTPTVPGALLTYTGTVRNSGNITLTNVVIVNNLSGITPVFTAATLAPGAVLSFTGSYIAPTNCNVASTLTGTGTSICGVPVSNSASATCPILTTPAIVVTQVCPIISPLPGGILTYSGTVSNAGNITLTNIIVVSDEPATNTVIFTLLRLAPGEIANFTGSYRVPTNCCVVSSTVKATGQGCDAVTVSDTATRTCTVMTLPQLVVTKLCEPGILRPGDLLSYSGTVSNAGNITLINVRVVNNQPSVGSPVLGPLTLAPGEWFTFNDSYIVPADFCGTDTVTATGQDVCTFQPVIHRINVNCPVITDAPQIAVTKNCPLLPTTRGGLYTYTGTVSNPGTVTLVNVYVVDNRPTNNTPVIGPITLAPGQSVNFSASYTAPTCCCFILDTLTARGQDLCLGSNVTATATSVCPLLSTPSVALVQDCPVSPLPMGSLYTFSGFVTNTGDAVLTNVVVFGPQGTNTVLLGPIELAPGEVEYYFGSYTVPFNTCAVAFTVRGQDTCIGNTVTNLTRCLVATVPQIEVAVVCPPSPVVAGGSAAYTGTVRNVGNITLTNVMVMSDRPVANTIVFTRSTLAPGEFADFTSNYIVPTNACTVTTLFRGTGRDICGIQSVTNSTSATCTVATTPAIFVTETCPPGPIVAGSPVVFSGVVRNSGNITLTNVFVFSSQPSNGAPVLGPITLAPGASAPFSGSYIATGGSNPTTNSTIVTNSSVTFTTNVSNVITTNQTPVITTNAPTPVALGTINPTSQAAVDRFNIGTNFTGLAFNSLAFAGEDHGYGATQLYSMRKSSTGESFFDTITASTATTTDRFQASNRNFDALAYAAPDVGFGPLQFYYLSRSLAGVSTFGSIAPGGVVGVVSDRFVVGSNFEALTFAATDLGYGANMFYYIRRDASGLSTFGTINPALPGTITDRFPVGTNVVSLVFSPLSSPGFGPNNFYYLRQNTNGVSTFGTIFVTSLTTALVTDRFTVGTNATDLTFTDTNLGFGADQFYYIRGRALSFTTNIVTTFTTNAVTTRTTNTVNTFVTNSVVTYNPTNTVTATGMDICQARTVSAAASCIGPIGPTAPVSVTSGTVMANGNYSLSFPTELGKTYTVQFKDSLSEPTWTDLQTVVGTGGNQTVTDMGADTRPMRFYRVITRQ